jgi:hypothetical protein
LCSDQCAHSYRLSVRRLSKEPNTKRPIETVNLLEYLLRELYNSYEKEKNFFEAIICYSCSQVVYLKQDGS